MAVMMVPIAESQVHTHQRWQAEARCDDHMWRSDADRLRINNNPGRLVINRRNRVNGCRTVNNRRCRRGLEGVSDDVSGGHSGEHLADCGPFLIAG